MPKVDGKHYAYTKEGRAQAEAAKRKKKRRPARASKATKKAMR